jgi:SAM-dependent methyltransferase
MLAAARKIYQTLFPMSARRALWNFRHGIWQRSGDQRPTVRRPRRYSGTGCKVCGGKNIAPFQNPRIQRLPYDFYLCGDCEFIFVHPMPDPAAYYTELEMPDFGAGVWNENYLEAIRKHTNNKGRLLELGFGNASFLKLAHDAGWEVYGADLNASLVRHATEVLRLPNIVCGTIEEIGYAPGYFDVVAAFNFIEHVPDPRATLRSIKRILRPGGLVVLLCPNLEGIYHLLVEHIFPDSDPLNLTWVPPDHVGYFNKRNLRLLIENEGFTVVGDESHLTSDLWWQHEMNIGPKATDEKLRLLLAEIKSSQTPAGSARVAEYRERILKLLLDRMCWSMARDLIEIEPALGAENAVLLIGRDSGAKAEAPTK